MTTITTRSGKGSPLTNNEVDANFTNLNDDKVEASGDSMTGNLSFGDNNKAIFGAGSDLQIYHNGTHSYITDVGTGNLKIQSDGAGIDLTKGSSEFLATFAVDGAVTLYHNNSAKLATTSTGIDVTGTADADNVSITSTAPTLVLNRTDRTADNKRIRFAHDGEDFRIQLFNDAENAVTNAIGVNRTGMTLDSIAFYEDTGTTAKLTWDASAETLNFADNGKAVFGAGSDLQIYHDGGTGDSIIAESGTGSFFIRGANTFLQNAAGTNTYLKGVDGGAVDIRYGGSVKLATTSTGIDVTGTVTADGISSSGDITITESTPSISFVDSDGTNQIGKLRQVADTVILSARNNTAYGNFKFTGEDGSTEKTRLQINGSTGDISFYEDTGTTAKLLWSASNELLEVSSTGNGYAFRPSATTSDYALMHVQAQDGTAMAAIRLDGSSGLRFHTGGTNNAAERMRIDSSGNLLVGKTSTSGSTVGHAIKPNGQLEPTVDGSYVSYFNRKTSNGPISYFAKDGSTAGSIAVKADTSNNYMIIGKGSVGMQYASDSEANSVLPARPDNQSLRDAGIDLGASGTRFKDLYLSGNVTSSGTFRGGAGSASTPTFLTDGSTGMYRASANDIGFSCAGSEVARFDTSGNLLVATTSTLPQTATSGGGLCYAADSSLRIARESNGTGQPILDLNNTGFDDELIRLRKDGTTVGSIGCDSNSNFMLGQGDTGLSFQPSSDRIIPRNTDGSGRDGFIDLGGTGNRFKDLYLSGDVIAPNIVASNGVFLGGTSNANKLDDYEEGTFTPTLYGASSAGTTTYATVTGTYTKVGNRCTVNFVCNVTATTGTGSLRLGGLPFTSSGENTTAIMINNLNWGGGTYLMAYVGDNSDFARVYYVGDDNTWQQQQITNEAQHFIFTLSYQTA